MITNPHDFVWGAVFGITLIVLVFGGTVWAMRQR